MTVGKHAARRKPPMKLTFVSATDLTCQPRSISNASRMEKVFCLSLGKRIVATAGTAILLFMLGTSTALAHAQLIKSNPPDKAELKQAPTRVELWFNELLDNGFNSVEVISAADLSSKNHTNLAKGPPKVDPADRTHLTVEVSVLKPGKYVVQYRVLSRDGHTAPGRMTFRVLHSKS